MKQCFVNEMNVSHRLVLETQNTQGQDVKNLGWGSKHSEVVMQRTEERTGQWCSLFIDDEDVVRVVGDDDDDDASGGDDEEGQEGGDQTNGQSAGLVNSSE